MSDIFYKKKKIIKKDEILNNIPIIHFNEPQENIEGKQEWRWRIYTINSEEYIEISKMDNKIRYYLDPEGSWVNREISNYYDKFIKREIYAYLDITD
tara:strand:- start:418 stop:708 length:291 start_codon:yes stop_codon:yes gene_type:complete